jgi:hypothetical protein
LEEDNILDQQQDPEKKSRNRIYVFIISIVILVIILLSVYLYFQFSDSIFTGLIDTDGDGYNDDVDAFINDPNEWVDNDNDGIGDNADFFDNGNGGIYASIITYDGDGGVDTDENDDLDPYFIIWMDMNCNNIQENNEMNISSVYNDTDRISSPLGMYVDVPDDLEEIQIVISVFDSDFGDTDDVIDISNLSNTTVVTLRYNTLKDANSIQIFSNGSDDNIPNEDDAFIIVEYGEQNI